jgi:two-component system, OmpR family, response regulator RegX3
MILSLAGDNYDHGHRRLLNSLPAVTAVGFRTIEKSLNSLAHEVGSYLGVSRKMLSMTSELPQEVQALSTIFLVEDDTEIGGQLRAILEANNYKVTWCVTGFSALHAIREHTPDLVLLDIGLPDMDGFALCREMRATRKNVPIIMVTAADSDIDVVMGLDSGANDYVTKPFSGEVLLARIRAHLREAPAQPHSAPLQHRNIVVSQDSMSATCNGVLVDLRLRELELLLYLCRTAGRIVTRRELFAEVWDVTWTNHSKTLDMHIHALRRKFGDELNISTIRGVGYRLELA